MNTIVYISRHSQPFRNLLGEYNANEDSQLRNEKNPLSVEGERLAEKLSSLDELKNVDVLYSSNYVRAMSTAKYICEKNNIKLNVDAGLGERKHGVDPFNLPDGYELNQWLDPNYKLGNGESVNEVTNRMFNSFKKIYDSNKGKNIMIVCHATSLLALFRNYTDVKPNVNSRHVEVFFNNNLIFDGNFSAPELFKMEFDENDNLIDIRNIRS